MMLLPLCRFIYAPIFASAAVDAALFYVYFRCLMPAAACFVFATHVLMDAAVFDDAPRCRHASALLPMPLMLRAELMPPCYA